LYLRGHDNSELVLRDDISLSNMLAGRREAEEIALACNLPLLDLTTERPMIRNETDLLLGYKGRLERDGINGNLAPAPLSVGSTFSSDGRTASIYVPPAGMGMRHWALVVLLSAMIALVASVFLLPLWLEGRASWRLVAVVMAVVTCVSAVSIGTAVVRARKRQTWVEASPDGIMVAARAPGWSRRWTIAADEIEEIAVVPRADAASVWFRGPALLVQGPTERVGIGHGLDIQELSWMKDVLDFFVVGKLARAREATVVETGETDLAACAPVRMSARSPWAIRTATTFRWGVAVGAMIGIAGTFFLADQVHAYRQRDGAEAERAAAKARQESEELQRIMGKIAGTLSDFVAIMEKELKLVQAELLDALRIGDVAVAERLWVPDGKAGTLDRSDGDNRSAREEGVQALGAFSRLLRGLPDATGVTVIPPKKGGIGGRPLSQEEATRATVGWIATFGFRVESSQRVEQRIDFEFQKIGRWYLTAVEVAPNASSQTRPTQ